jgi:SprT-like protein
MFQLETIFEEINRRHFDGFLDPPVLEWNSRLRSSAGRFYPGSRKWLRDQPPKIEVASYLRTEERAAELIRDTIAHEMIHYWLWVRRRPYGHTEEFLRKMKEMGCSRYNPVPRLREPKYLYRCPKCEKDFPARRKLAVLACLDCCKRESGGKFDRRFMLELITQLR